MEFVREITLVGAHANAPLGLLIRLLDIRLARLTSDLLAPAGVSLAEISVLRMIGEHAGIQASALAEALSIKPPNLSKLLNRLESVGLLRRASSRRDVRAIALTLTPKGRNIVAFGQKVSGQVQDFSLRDLNADEQDILLGLLRKALGSRQADGAYVAHMSEAAAQPPRVENAALKTT